MTTAIALVPAAAGDLDRLFEMMADFNAGEGIVIERETWRPALLRLLAEPDLGRVWLIAEGGALASPYRARGREALG